MLQRARGRTEGRTEFEREAMPHLDALFGTAIRLTRNEKDAEDLVQDALLRAYRFWHHFEPGTNCKAWLFRILTNAFINRYHKGRREQDLTKVVAEDATLTEELHSRESQARARDPEGTLLGAALSEDVQRALDALPIHFRLPVILCDVQELSYKEIAEALECPVGTVMSRLHRGRRLLAKELRGYATELGIVKAPAAATSSSDAISMDAFRKQRDKGGA